MHMHNYSSCQTLYQKVFTFKGHHYTEVVCINLTVTKHTTKQKVCVQQHPLAVNMALSVLADERCTAALCYCSPLACDRTVSSCSSAAATGQMDTIPLHRPCSAVCILYTVRGQSGSASNKYSASHTTLWVKSQPLRPTKHGTVTEIHATYIAAIRRFCIWRIVSPLEGIENMGGNTPCKTPKPEQTPPVK